MEECGSLKAGIMVRQGIADEEMEEGGWRMK